MNFIYKCLLQHILSVIPKGETINYLLQKHVTHNLPLSIDGFLSRTESTNMFYNFYSKYSSVKPQESLCFEFSSGAHLQNPIGLSLLGIKEIYTYDVNKIAKPEFLNSTIMFYKNIKDKIQFDYKINKNLPEVTLENTDNFLLKYFNIHYIAPSNIKNTEIKSNSIDLVISRTTLEHIPKNDIIDIIKECHRILKKDAIAIFSIDYRDHWSFFDKNISIYNFLKYNQNTWKFFNPAIHFQNRLRHIDYINIFNQLNFISIETIAIYPDNKEKIEFNKIKLSSDYIKNYDSEQLLIKRGVFVLKKG